MNAIANVTPALALYTPGQLALIKNTVAKDCNPMEFDLFVTVARNAGLDPFRKQISAIVFSKDNAEKRRMSIITTIDGLRVIAARSRRYRPDEEEPRIEYDPNQKSDTNPLGIVKATVRVYIADAQREGGWKPVAGVAYWDEFAPIKDEWAWNDEKRKREPTGRQTLDGNWPKMGRVMISKCAEAQALRKAFPEDMSALYEAAELDRAQAAEFTPSEIVEQAEAENRLTKIGGHRAIMFQLFPNAPLEAIPLGQVADKVMGAAREFSAVQQHRWFMSANTQPLREFWAHSPSDALAVKKFLEEVGTKLAATEAAA
jgi:phage recombination protein Bet